MIEGIVIAISSLCLGFFIGGMVTHYVARVREFTLRGLTSVITIIGGASVLGIFKFFGHNTTSIGYWFYPIGLFIGGAAMALFHSKFIEGVDEEKTHQKRQKTGRRRSRR
jgi:hypothetical protein